MVPLCSPLGGSKVLWRARLLCGWLVGYEVFLERGAGSGEHNADD